MRTMTAQEGDSVFQLLALTICGLEEEEASLKRR
jgi:hypothetical protein